MLRVSVFDILNPGNAEIVPWVSVKAEWVLNQPSSGIVRGPAGGKWHDLLWSTTGAVTIDDLENGLYWSGYPMPTQGRRETSDGLVEYRLGRHINLLHSKPVFPTINPAVWTGNTHRVYTGTCSTALTEMFVDEYGADATTPTVALDIAAAPSPAFGGTIEIRSRATATALEWAHLKGTNAGVVVDAVWDADAVNVSLSEAVDRTQGVVFDPRHGNAATWSKTDSLRSIEGVVAAGQGEGVARTVQTDSIVSPQFNRWRYLDRRNVDTTAQLTAEATALLAEGAQSTSIGLELTDTADQRAGIDYLLGDLVKVRLGDFESVEPITELLIEADSAGIRRRAKAGHGDLHPHARTLADVAELERRVTQLEGAT